MFKNKLLISSLLLACTSTSVFAEIDKSVVAVVNGQNIIAEELVMTAEQNKIDYKVLNDQQKKLLLNGLINRILVAEEAKKQKLDQEEDVKLKVNAIVDSILAATLLENETKSIKLNDADISAYYEKNIKTNVQKQYKARHILVTDEEEAKKISTDLSADSSKFASVAKEKSIDKGSAVKGGDLDWFNPASMVPTFAAAVKSATTGKVTAPVKSQFGWHIILVEDSKAIEPPTLEASKGEIEQILTKEKVTVFLDKLVNKAKIEIKIGQ